MQMDQNTNSFSHLVFTTRQLYAKSKLVVRINTKKGNFKIAFS